MKKIKSTQAQRKHLKRTLLSALLVSTLFAAPPTFGCATYSDGIYVADDDSDAIFDKGKFSRVIRLADNPEPSYSGTTAQFTYVYLVNKSSIALYRTIANAIDDKYQSLSTVANVTPQIECDGKFSLEFEVGDYYPNEIKIGAMPKVAPKSVLPRLKAHISGQVLADGNWRLDGCQAYKLRKKGWRETDDDLGLCNDAKGNLMFNIKQRVIGKKGWESIKP